LCLSWISEPDLLCQKAVVLTFEDGDAHHHDRDDHHDLDGLLASLLVIFVDFAIVVCRRSVSP
jgi:hypothetical protein